MEYKVHMLKAWKKRPEPFDYEDSEEELYGHDFNIGDKVDYFNQPKYYNEQF